LEIWATVAPPTQRNTTFSVRGSTTKKLGHASTGNLARKGPPPAFSVFIESQTNCPARRWRDWSVKTKALIERHVCHQGAQASMKRGTPRDRACASALP
jgi:hypothetical protein